jgi:hypothetical protein
MFDLFEQPWTLVGAAVLVLFGMLTFRSVLPEKRRWWQLAVPAFIVAAAFGTDLLVQTDREKIYALLKKGMKAIEQEDPNALAAIISADYNDSYHNSKQELMAHTWRQMERSGVQKIKKNSALIQVSPPHASANIIVLVRFEQDSYIAQNYKPWLLIKIRINFQKQPDKSWLINRAEVLEVDKQPVQWRQAGNIEY